MPGVLGWTAARGHLEWGALVMFAIVFFWQFPHFFSIAWLYREDYASGGIRMLPVVHPDGRSTSVRIILYSIVLIPVTLAPTLLGMSGKIYFVGAIVMGIALCYFGWPPRLTRPALKRAALKTTRAPTPPGNGHLLALAVRPHDAQHRLFVESVCRMICGH